MNTASTPSTENTRWPRRTGDGLGIAGAKSAVVVWAPEAIFWKRAHVDKTREENVLLLSKTHEAAVQSQYFGCVSAGVCL